VQRKGISLKKNFSFMHVRRYVFIEKNSGIHKEPASKVVNILDTINIYIHTYCIYICMYVYVCIYIIERMIYN